MRLILFIEALMRGERWPWVIAGQAAALLAVAGVIILLLSR